MHLMSESKSLKVVQQWMHGLDDKRNTRKEKRIMINKLENYIEITDLYTPKLEIYTGQKEVQLLHYFEPEPGIFIAETPMVIARALDAGYEPLSVLADVRLLGTEAQKVIERCQRFGQLSVQSTIPVYVGEEGVLRKLTGFPLTRGLLCAMRRRPHPSIAEICSRAKRIAVLESVMNPTNVGAIFRSAAAIGMDAVLLVGGCSDPLYRRAARVSMGTVFQIPWTVSEACTAAEVSAALHTLGFRLAAMALSEHAVSIEDPRLLAEEKLAVVFGTEGEGLCAETIDACDYVVKIPMAHGVDSLNVAAASAVAFWQLRQKTDRPL